MSSEDYLQAPPWSVRLEPPAEAVKEGTRKAKDKKLRPGWTDESLEGRLIHWHATLALAYHLGGTLLKGSGFGLGSTNPHADIRTPHGVSIDCRPRQGPRRGLIVYPHDEPLRPIHLVMGDWRPLGPHMKPKVLMWAGWCYRSEAPSIGKVVRMSKLCWIVPPEKLRRPDEFYEHYQF